MRVGVIGASGYVGGELLRILLQHSKVEVTLATSRTYADEFIYRIHPNLRGLTNLKFYGLDPIKAAGSCDLVFTAVPHGTSHKIIPAYLESGFKVIDLSADFRLRDPAGYQKWYGYEHPRPDLLQKAAYGLPELHREEIKQAQLVACPGCMSAASILALAPLAKAGVIEKDKIVVDVKIGSSGAGVRPTLGTHHAERSNIVRPYKVVGHRHTGEIEQELSLLRGEPLIVSMTPHAVNIVRGILSTCHTFTTQPVNTPDLWKLYRGFYHDEPFIRFVKDRKGLFRLPDPKVVVGSNFCDLGFEIDDHINRVVAISAIDNLLKGAAGTAVQCLNVMHGFEEKTGLEFPGIHPV